MNIQELEVKRDENGFWTHPDVPEWDESVKDCDIVEWLNSRGLELVSVVMFDGDAEEDIHDRYYEAEDNTAVADWVPTKPDLDDSFLLSLHETDNGPIAVFVRKVKQC